MNKPTDKKEQAPPQPVDDEVDEAGKESFPASDPPAWNAGKERNK